MDPFVICRLEGKGLGMVAKRDLQPGELVIEESPLVTSSIKPVMIWNFLKILHLHNSSSNNRT